MLTRTRTIIACASAAMAAAAIAAPFDLGGAAALASQHVNAGAATAPIQGVPRCLTSELSAGLHGSQALVANRGFILTLTNTSNSACTLDGYPGLGIEDASHHVLPSNTHWGSTYFDQDPGPSLIELSPGETASADFAYATGAGNWVTYLEITPPNTFQHLTIAIPGAPVQVARGQLSVTAMARHTPYNT